jgi:hypothetical protein
VKKGDLVSCKNKSQFLKWAPYCRDEVGIVVDVDDDGQFSRPYVKILTSANGMTPYVLTTDWDLISCDQSEVLPCKPDQTMV